MKGAKRWPVRALPAWVGHQPPKVKSFLSVVTGMAALVFLLIIVHGHDNLLVAAKAVHSIGICVLIYKFSKEKNCVGLSLKSQELTAVFLAVKLCFFFMMEYYNIHTILDTATLATTLWVIYMIRFKLRSTYMEDKDNFGIYCVVIPCVVLSLLFYPSRNDDDLSGILWAFCLYLEPVSVLPQLKMMQNTKIVEPFTTHYIFALGVTRFLVCANWMLEVRDTGRRLLKGETALGYEFWLSMVLLSDIVHTLILSNFCCYYVKSIFEDQLVPRLPSGVM